MSESTDRAEDQDGMATSGDAANHGRRDVTWEVISERIRDLIIMADLQGRIVYASPGARHFGYEPFELLGETVESLVHPEDLEDFRAQAASHRVRCKDGSWVWLEGEPTVLPGADGASAGVLTVFRDVTEQEELKAKLRDALARAEQAATVKGEFLANMSHEIRTPLTAILGFAGLLAERRDLDELAQGQIGRIVTGGRALLSVVNDVLDFSKLEAGEITIRRRPADPTQIAREVVEIFALQAESKGVDLALDVAPGLPPSLVLDDDRVRQILANLVGNAVKFTERGRVRLALDYDSAEGQLLAEVSDTGAGIPAEAAAKLFQRFSQVDGSSTRSKGGTGLGLAICLGLTEAMGGSVSVDSVVGEGSTFRLEIPALRGASEDPQDGSGDIIERLCGLRVLVVDDNMVNRELARAILEPAGVEVSEAQGGREAVQAAQRLPFDVILMDLRMPDMDGRTAVAAIRTAPGPNQHMPILAFSADGMMDLGAAENAGFQGVVRKPTSPAELLRALLLATADDQDLEEGIPYAAAS